MSFLKTLCSFLLYCFLCTTVVFGQNTVDEIRGVVKNENGELIELATISLFQNNRFVSSAVSDVSGKFTLTHIAPGTYVLRTDHLSYASYESESFYKAPDKTLILADIVLSQSVSELDEVVLVDQKQFIRVKADKIIFNVASSPSASGTNGLDLLKLSPGVTIDFDNSISLLGKGNVQVYLNGVQSRLSGSDLTNFLQSLTSDTVESIEIISNPGAQYEAEGTGGIINIRLKKSLAGGLNGNATSSFTKGEEYRYSNNVALNLGGGKLQMNLDLTQSHNNTLQIFDDRIQQNNAELFGLSRENQIQDGYNIGLGLESQIGDKHYIGLDGRAILNTTENRLVNFTDIFTVEPPEFTEILFSRVQARGNSDNYLFNGFHLWNLEDGSSITTNLSLGTYNSDQITLQPNTYFETDGATVITTEDSRFDADTRINLWSAKSDYQKSWETISLSAGFKYAEVKTDNSFRFFNFENQTPVFDPAQSNDFSYTEKVSAAYINLNFKPGKYWSLNSGVRMEHTESRGQLFSEVETENNDVSRSYTDFFPNLGLSYDDEEKHSLSLSLGRRITRPVYQDLNPFERPNSQLVIWKGNPFLNPNYIMNYQASYAYKQKYVLTTYYSETTDFFSRIVETTGEETTQIIPRNMEKATNLGLSVSVPIQLSNSWEVLLFGNLFQETFKGDVESTFIDLSNWQWDYRIQNIISLPADILVDVTFTQRSRWIWRGSVFISGNEGLSFGIRKDFFNNKLQLRITGADILRTQSDYPYTSDYGGIDLDGVYTADNRRFGAGLTYNFGGKKSESKKKKGALDEELERIQN